MIEACMAVCGDKAYFDMADISIPSFLRANPGCNLHVFSDDPSRLASDNPKLNVYDFEESLKRCEALDVMKINTLSRDFMNNGIQHRHPFVALLPLLAQEVIDSEHILKVDVDSFYLGNMISEIEKMRFLMFYDLCLVQRRDNKIMKLYAGAPGVGFLLWRKDGKFVEQYVSQFSGHEQTDILALRGKVKYAEIGNGHYHITYPFYQARKLGSKLTKEKIESWGTCYLHLRGEEKQTQLEKLELLKEWFE